MKDKSSAVCGMFLGGSISLVRVQLLSKIILFVTDIGWWWTSIIYLVLISHSVCVCVCVCVCMCVCMCVFIC